MLEAQLTGIPRAHAVLEALSLTPQEKKHLMRRIGREVVKNTRKRIRQKKDLSGKAWADRRTPKKRKMMRGISKRLRAYPSTYSVDVTFANALTGKIARAQQEGIDSTMTARRMEQIHGTKDGQATRLQAKALRAEGFKKRRASGKGFGPASLKWIQANLTRKQAGAILRDMRGSKPQKKWVLPGTPRSFLGATLKEQNQLIDTALDALRK